FKKAKELLTKLKEFFKLKELKTDVYTETIAGLTTFVTMAYIIIVNPSILSSTGVTFDQVFIATITGVPAITAPELIIVGSYMMNGLAKVRWNEFDEAFPTFAIILTMPLTSGIAMGFFIYP